MTTSAETLFVPRIATSGKIAFSALGFTDRLHLTSLQLMSAVKSTTDRELAHLVTCPHCRQLPLR